LNDAIAFVDQHPDAAKEYMRKYIPAQFRDQVSLYPDASYLQSTQTSDELFQKEADANLKLGIIPTPLAVGSLVYRGN
jgi:ABC-type nitrate/sulfonate/bicarbonate transport system substrate-binding protein